jgi:predicted RNase H-like HicB family nuclease
MRGCGHESGSVEIQTDGGFRTSAGRGFTCRFAELPEIFSEGETVDEARANLWDALEQVMAYHREEAQKSAAPGAVREELGLAAS